MGKIGKRYFVVDEAIFSRRVHIFLNYSDSEFNEWCYKNGAEKEEKERKHDNFSGYSTSLTDTKDGFCEYMIVIKKFNWTIDDMNTLVHEIGHTIIKIWSANHMVVNFDTQEFFCHSLGNLYADIAAKIIGAKKKISTPRFNKKPNQK